MKSKLPRILQFLLLFALCFAVPIYADDEVQEDVVVTANINQDTYSTVVVNPSTVEIYESADVTVTVRDGNLAPLVGHSIELVAPGLSFDQPTQTTNALGVLVITVSSSSTGVYEICAEDTTDPEVTVEIMDCATLYVVPVAVPTMIAEPTYSPGVTNSVFWNSLGGGYQYYVEMSTSSDFSTVEDSSGWILGTMHEFDSLENNQMYFYRVKSRNSYGAVSGWSNVVFSVQDSEYPTILLISVGDIGDNNTVEWEAGYEIVIQYSVDDNLHLEETNFYCVKQDSSKEVCGDTVHDGATYTTTLRLSDLEKDDLLYLFSQYEFCVDATDGAGNTEELCGVKLNIPVFGGEPTGPEEPQPETPSPIPAVVEKVINDVVDTTEALLQDAFGDLTDENLEEINTTATVATVTVGLGTLLGGLLYIPIYLFELFLSFLSWLGLRKKGELSGIVYDSESKNPISQAVVRVYNRDKKLIWTDVSGSRGFFELALEDGEYRIDVIANNYSYPSKVIFGKADYPLENVYHGEFFSVENGKIPEFSIPLDSAELKWFDKLLVTLRSRLQILWKVLSLVVFVFGLVFSIYTYSVNDNVFNLVIIMLYIPSFVLVVRGLFKSRLGYGVVQDEEGNVVSDVSIGLRDVEYQKIVGKRVTDGEGMYRFIVDKGLYSLEVLDTGYELVGVEKRDPRKLSDGSVLIALDIVVKRLVVEK